MFEHYVHEIISTPKGVVLIDVTNTPDCGWEGAYARFNEKVFSKNWIADGDEPYTMNDIIEWGEDLKAFEDMIVVSSHHRNPETTLRNLMKELNKAE